MIQRKEYLQELINWKEDHRLFKKEVEFCQPVSYNECSLACGSDSRSS